MLEAPPPEERNQGPASHAGLVEEGGMRTLLTLIVRQLDAWGLDWQDVLWLAFFALVFVAAVGVAIWGCR